MGRSKFCVMIGATIASLLLIEIVGQFVVSSRRLPDDVFRLYRDAYERVHHLRDLSLERWPYGDRPETLIYSVITPFGPEKTNILIQGDSWSEQLSLSAPSLKAAEDVARTLGLGLVNAGTTSYAPSPMTTQLRYLSSRFGVQADIVLAFIDHTDIGDELCRYRNRLRFDDAGHLTAVAPEHILSEETFTMAREIRRQEVYRPWYVPALAKLAIVAYEKIAQDIRRTEAAPRCGWTAISRYLKDGLSEPDHTFFGDRLDGYLETAFDTLNVERVVLATHPHSKHLDNGEYRISMAPILREAAARSAFRERITVIDGTDFLASALPGQSHSDIFRPGDPASHLTDAYHARFFEHLLAKTARSVQ